VIAGAEDKLGKVEAGVKSAAVKEEKEFQNLVSSIPKKVQIN
jgi:hypothetical protein